MTPRSREFQKIFAAGKNRDLDLRPETSAHGQSQSTRPTTQIDPQHSQDHADDGVDLHGTLPQGHGPRGGGLGLYEADHRPGRPPHHGRAGGQASAAGSPCRNVEGRAAGALGQSRPVRRIQRQRAAPGPEPVEAAPGRRRPRFAWKSPASGASRPFASARSTIAERFTQFDDKPTFAEVEVLANRYLEWYQSGRLDRLDVVYTKFESLGRQYAVAETLLPLAQLDGAAKTRTTNGGQRSTSSCPRRRALSTRSCRPVSR